MRTAVLADTRRANSAASADGCRMNSASTNTAISAGSTADDTDCAMARRWASAVCASHDR
jgi:hypothetical protein